MEVREWAKNEVKIACELERMYAGSDCDVTCYQSALEAFNNLIDDDPNGVSIELKKQILMRLIAGLPLSPISEENSTWDLFRIYEDKSREYLSSRFNRLHKIVYPNNTIEYKDYLRTICVDLDSVDGSFYYSRLVSDVINDLFPIKLPYFPSVRNYKVCCDTFLFDKTNGLFDTRAILNATTPDGDIVEINRYFADKNGVLEEIDESEYIRRKKLRVKNKQVEVRR